MPSKLNDTIRINSNMSLEELENIRNNIKEFDNKYELRASKTPIAEKPGKAFVIYKKTLSERSFSKLKILKNIVLNKNLSKDSELTKSISDRSSITMAEFKSFLDKKINENKQVKFLEDKEFFNNPSVMSKKTQKNISEEDSISAVQNITKDNNVKELANNFREIKLSKRATDAIEISTSLRTKLIKNKNNLELAISTETMESTIIKFKNIVINLLHDKNSFIKNLSSEDRTLLSLHFEILSKKIQEDLVALHPSILEKSTPITKKEKDKNSTSISQSIDKEYGSAANDIEAQTIIDDLEISDEGQLIFQPALDIETQEKKSNNESIRLEALRSGYKKDTGIESYLSTAKKIINFSYENLTLKELLDFQKEYQDMENSMQSETLKGFEKEIEKLILFKDDDLQYMPKYLNKNNEV